MGKKRSPRVVADVTTEIWERARAADSGGCVVADAIKAAHPELSNVRVDVVQIVASDRAKGERYEWAAPETARNLLLYFDQGWQRPDDHRVTLNGARKVTKIHANSKRTVEQRRARRAELEAREAAGEELTGRERRSLRELRQRADRPAAPGPSEVVDDEHGRSVVIGGEATPNVRKRQANPNLLAGRNRLFGARTAKPAKVFQDAVEVEVARRLAEMTGGDADATGGDASTPAEGSR